MERGTVVDKDTQVVRPVVFQLFKLDTARMVDLLWSAPHRSDKDLEQSDVIIEVPTPEGVMMAFRIVHFSIMEPGLQKRYPHFRSFSGIGVDNKNWSILLGWTGKGLHATVRTSSKTILIDPFNRGDKTTYLVAYRKDFRRSGTFKCETGANERRGVDERGQTNHWSACKAWFLRLAVATTAEYSNYFGAYPWTANKEQIVMGEVYTAINRVNEVYRRDCGVQLILVTDNDQLFYFDPGLDPYNYSINQSSGLIDQNQTNIDQTIGFANYDIGHVFHQYISDDGLAILRSACGGSKAKGATAKDFPTNDPFYIDYVAHEIGHQLGATHTFNTDSEGACSLLGQRAPDSAFEPGSGSTIMGYANICGAHNVQMSSDDYFQGKSVDEVRAFVSSSTCAIGANLNRSSPSVSLLDNTSKATIPIKTPFWLKSTDNSGSEEDWFYCWEQWDNELASPTLPIH